MSKLISFIGASGAGKTSLLRALAARGDFALGFESHAERPFQALFKHDPRHALANQIDFLLYGAEQERRLSIALLCASTGLECSGHESPPGFTNPLGDDFTLLSSSPNIDSGVLISGINDDFAGSAPDIGAYEFGTNP